MRTRAPQLLPIFRSKLQGELLAVTLLQPERSRSLTELANQLSANVATIQREVSRLERAGILETRRVGRTRLVVANTASPVYRPLAELVLQAFGPVQMLAEEVAKIDGVQDAYLFGSWAARYREVEGPSPEDVDVLVVGDPDRDEVYESVLRMEHRLGREVNVTIRSKEAWEQARDGFVRQVRSSPLVRVPPWRDREANEA